jgi:hypothetical protein
MVMLAPSVFPLQASKAAWGGLLRSPRGGLSLPAQVSIGSMAVIKQHRTRFFLWDRGMLISFASACFMQLHSRRNSTLYEGISGLKDRGDR